MTTAEYGVGALGTATIACGLITLVDAGWFGDLFEHIFDVAFTKTLPEILGLA